MLTTDDYGRFHANITTIRCACWPRNPAKHTDKQVSGWLNECLSGDRPLIKKYEAEGSEFIEIQEFKQRTRGPSKFPEPVRYLTDACQSNDGASRRRIPETKAETYRREWADGFTQFWALLPKKRKLEKMECLGAWSELCPPQELVQRTLAKLLAAARVYYSTGELKYMLWPLRWLKKQRWEDEALDGTEREIQGVSDKTQRNIENIKLGLGLQDDAG